MEVRASGRQLSSYMVGWQVAVVLVPVLFYLRLGRDGVVPGLAFAVLVPAVLALYVVRSRIHMDHLTFTRRGLLGTRGFARSDARDIVLAPYQATGRDKRVVLTLFVRDHAGRRILRLTSAVWSPVDLEMLAHTIGPRPTVHTEVLTPATHEQLHPGSTPLAKGNAERGRLLAALAVVVFLGVVVLVYL